MLLNEWNDICGLCQENGFSALELGLSENMSFDKALTIVHFYIEKKNLSHITKEKLFKELHKVAEKYHRNLIKLIEEEQINNKNFNVDNDDTQEVENTSSRRRMRR